MERKGRIRFLVAIIATILLMSYAQAETIEEKSMREDYTHAYKYIDQLGKAGDISGLKRDADDISINWKTRNIEYYGNLMLRLCQVLRSDVSPKNIPFEDIYSIANRALETYNPQAQDNISIETHYWLLVQLQEHPTYPKGSMGDEEYAVKRRNQAERWMIVWDRMKAAIDSTWDPNEELFVNVMPPVETQLPAGVSPDAINDPALRAQYRKAIEDNAKKVLHDTEQRRLRKLEKQLNRSLVLYFGGTYSVAPYNDLELENLLARHIDVAEIRSTIFRTVQENKPKDETGVK